MKSNKTKTATLEALDTMIQNAAQGPSGFWVEDYEGCGNPRVFQEFEEGLTRGRLVQKYPKQKELFAAYYGQNAMVSTYDGVIDFNPDGFLDIVGAEKFTYDDYIEVQIRSFHKTRVWFVTCYYNIPLSFKGCIERKTNRLCFKES